MPREEILQKIAALPGDADEDAIRKTAEELEMINFTPTLLIDTPGLFYMKKADILSAMYQLMCLPSSELPEFNPKSFIDAEDFRNRQIDLLYFSYELLTRLRRSEPEAWDYVHELYEDD